MIISQKEAIDLLNLGQIGVAKSDTIYGLMVRADQPEAMKRLSELKERKGKLGTVLGANIEQLETLGIKRRYLKAASDFWPGPVSVLLFCQNQELTMGEPFLAVRIPSDKRMLAILEKTGPLATTSANLSDQKPAQSIDEAIKIFGNKVDFYLDDGPVTDNTPSAIIQIIDDQLMVLREGTTIKKDPKKGIL